MHHSRVVVCTDTQAACAKYNMCVYVLCVVRLISLLPSKFASFGLSLAAAVEHVLPG